MVLFGLEAHRWTQKQIKAGIPASQIAKNFYNYYVDNGFKDNFVYGPLHGTGMIEVEAPWVETDSNLQFTGKHDIPNRYLHFNRYLWCSLGKRHCRNRKRL